VPNFNKVIIVGHTTRDVDIYTFNSGGKVANFGIAVNNGYKDKDTGEWKNNPCFLDCKMFGRGDSKRLNVLSDVAKGSPLLVEGRLEQENWEDKNGGGKRSKIVILVDNFSFISKREANSGEHGDSPVSSQASQKYEPRESQEEIPF
jgi:single-strand DNA-binding protein